MDVLFQLFIFILLGIVLLWLGFTMFFHVGKATDRDGGGSPRRLAGKRLDNSKVQVPRESGIRSPRWCPICGVLLPQRERVKSSAFLDPGNGQGRLMYIEGCVYCLEGPRVGKRRCPVCNAALNRDEIVFARMFEKPGRSHVHVLGCSRCRGPGTGK